MDKELEFSTAPFDGARGSEPKAPHAKARGRVVKKPKKEKKREESLDELISAIAAAIPDEELKQFPKDLSFNFEHYMYGAPRQ